IEHRTASRCKCKSQKLRRAHWAGGSWSCADRNHQLNVVERTSGHLVDWWNFARWNFAVMNEMHKAVTYVAVLRVNEHELHLTGGGHLYRLGSGSPSPRHAHARKKPRRTAGLLRGR